MSDAMSDADYDITKNCGVCGKRDEKGYPETISPVFLTRRHYCQSCREAGAESWMILVCSLGPSLDADGKPGWSEIIEAIVMTSLRIIGKSREHLIECMKIYEASFLESLTASFDADGNFIPRS